jgi:hypothetical protein
VSLALEIVIPAPLQAGHLLLHDADLLAQLLHLLLQRDVLHMLSVAVSITPTWSRGSYCAVPLEGQNHRRSPVYTYKATRASSRRAMF